MRKHNTLQEKITELRKFYARQKYLPSYSQMCQMFGFASKHAVTRVVDELVDRGYVLRSGGALSPTTLFFSIPHLGFIKAGDPTQIDTDFYSEKNTIYVGEDLSLTNGSIFALTVSGDSMINAGILNGDVAILDRSKDACHGDIIAACVDDAWTLKYLRKSSKGTFLEAANPAFAPIHPDATLVTGGVLIKIIRNYQV